MRTISPRAPLRNTLLLGAAALGLSFAPADVHDAIRATVHDATRPGHAALRRVEAWRADLVRRIVPASGRPDELAALRENLARWQLRCRRLQLENARLVKRLDKGESASAGEPLIVPELVAATVLGKENTGLLRAGALVDRGTSAGLAESALVLEAAGPLIDQGEGSGLTPGQPVYAGRAVLGRIERVGRWVSRVRQVTDPEYSDFVQLARPTPDGLVFGPRGLLRGQGKALCRVERIEGTASVSPGDEVYSVPLDETLSEPMYYGRVVEAELEDGGAHWRITVEPAAGTELPQTVHVLRKTINPERLLAN